MNDTARPTFRPAELWPDPDTGPWAIRLEWSEIDGRHECTGVTIRSFSPTDEADLTGLPDQDSTTEMVTAAMWRSVPIGSLIAAKRRRMLESFSPGGVMHELRRGDDEFSEYAKTWKPSRSTRRKPRAHFELVAEIYQRAQRAGLPPTKSVQDEMGPMSYSTAAKWVGECRRLGLLPSTTRGVPSATTNKRNER